MNDNLRNLTNSHFPRLAAGICLVIALLPSSGTAAALKEITGFGNNPSKIKMYLYVPDKVQANPPILVGMHWCHGTGPAFYSGTGFAALADKYGFILICPNANSSDSCWDVHSNAVLTHNGGGDASGIISMVQYVVKNYHADSTRVYATGHSSGAMMTNVMLGSYPDVFKAGAAFAGVPFSCFSGTNSWNSDCAAGKISKTGAAWGDAVRAAYPDYTGPRPRIQLWHGDQDGVLNFNNFGEEIKEWTNVLGVSATPTSTENNQPQSTWVRTRYTNSSGVVEVEAIKETGQPHNLQIVADKAVTFLTLDVPTTVAAPVDKILLEAENGQLSAGAAAVSDASRSNGAYVNLQGGSIAWTDSLTKAGTYDISLNMSSPYGTKINSFFVDGDSSAFTVDSSVAFGSVTVAKAVTLQPGKHTFTLGAQWGWIDVDYLKLVAPTTGIRTFASVGTPKAVTVPGGLQLTGLDGIRRIRVMDLSGHVVAVDQPAGATAWIPLEGHRVLILSYEGDRRERTNSRIVLP